MLRAGTVRLLPLATAVVVLVGILVAVVMAALGVARLRGASDQAALDKALLIARTAAIRLGATAIEDRFRTLERIGERTGADCMIVDQSGAVLLDTSVGAPATQSVSSMLESERGFTETSTGRAAFAIAELAAPYRNLAIITFVHAPAAPSSTRPFGKAVALLAVTLVSAASGAAYAFSRNANDDVEFVRHRIEQMASAGVGPVAERVPIRTHDQVGALTSAFNAMVDRFSAAERAYRADLSEADSLDQARARFLAVLSHEMRTPLHGVLGFAEVLLSEVDGPLSTSAREDVEIIHASAENLRGLIDDILDLSAIETGNLRLDRGVHDLRGIAQRAVRESSSLVVSKGLSLVLLPGEPVLADVDARRIRQILVNLLGNAIKFTSEGGVEIRAMYDDEHAILEVSDTGPGISPAEIALIFDEFRQVGDLATQRKGTGLGLAIARRLTRMHDGTLSVRSDLGRGATFRVELPRVHVEPAELERVLGNDPLDSFARLRHRRGPGRADVNAADRLIPTILLIQLITGVSVFLVFLASAQGLLLLDPQQTRGAALTTLVVGALAETTTMIVLFARLRRIRFVLRALALGSRAFELDQLVELGDVPAFVTTVSVTSSAGYSALTLAPAFRDSSLDFPTAMSLLLLAILLIAAAGVPLYALTRSAVSRVLELVPADEGGEVIALLESEGIPLRRVRAHMLAAVVTPTFFVAVGAALVAYAHLKTEQNHARIDAAVAVTRACLDTFDGALPEGGLFDAVDEAQDIAHLTIRLWDTPSLYTVERISSGRVRLTVPLTSGHAEVFIEGPDGNQIQTEAILAVLLVLIIATWLGASIGGLLGDDLVLATRQIAQLGNEEVLRGEARIARPARLRVVAELGRAIETLADRFREFAGAQERAIEAREAALRLRGLLFASVSHDLKSPLNAVLGFCALLDVEPLIEAQRESVRIIERRARELLALIEIILDAARIEARQLALRREITSVDEVVDEAVRRGDDLGPIDAEDVGVRVSKGLPEVRWDTARIAQALAALVGHAKRLSPKGGVEVIARRASAGIEVLVHEPSGAIPPEELISLLDARNAATAPRRLGGLALGLSLARSLIELHGGSLEVAHAGQSSGSVFVVTLPL